MELYDHMPVVHFKPITKRAKALPNSYGCPCYYYPNRAGSVARDSYIMQIDLKSGEVPPTFCIKSGTGVLLSNAL
jgi:dynein heavy chain